MCIKGNTLLTLVICFYFSITSPCYGNSKQVKDIVVKQLTPTQRIIIRDQKKVWQHLVFIDEVAHWVDEDKMNLHSQITTNTLYY